MNRRVTLSALALGCALALSALLAPLAAAVPAPAWHLQSLSAPAGFIPGDASGLARYEVFLTNVGAKASDGSPITITDTLPAGLGVKGVELVVSREPFIDLNRDGDACEEATVATVTTVTCTLDKDLFGVKEPARLEPLEQAQMMIQVTVPESAAVVPLTNRFEIEGGGVEAIAAETHNEIDPACKADPDCVPAGFQDFQNRLTGEDGSAVSAAGSHPFQFITSFGVNLKPAPAGSDTPLVPAGGDLKEIEVELPPGLIANPQATGRCTAQQFNTVHTVTIEGLTTYKNECPDGSAVGVALIEQLEGRGHIIWPAPIYNLVPPPGMPAQLGFQPDHGLPIYINAALEQGPQGLAVRAHVHKITEASRVSASLIALWGTPGDPSHDAMRGKCTQSNDNCPANLPTVRPSFRLPTSCESPLAIGMGFDTWLHPGAFVRATTTEAAPVGCAAPDFSPQVEAKPSTNVADSPSGLRFDLHLPQAENDDPQGLAEADLRDATVTLPPGLVVNPAAADGRTACSLAQIGLQSAVGASPIVFDQNPATCPPAAKVGKVEVDTPLLDRPIPGSVYLAAQEQNPFASTFAIYIALEDPRYGVTIKLAGKITPDPVTGQLTTRFDANPQVPFEDLRFSFFEGARAPLRTPATCGPHTTTTSLVPWTTPEGLTASPSDSFAIAQAPSGGPCVAATAQLPNAPSFEAGTANPLAGAYSPFLLRLKREDGSQELKGLNVTLPLGLTARLAGTPECSAAGVAQAQSRTNPGQGALEQQSPSCPAASQLGTVTVGAGAGPSPFYATGKAYLAGPYKGAPLSMLIVTPAVAGPFDLGSVAVRAALNVDPESAKVTVVSDPIPTILQGIPLDVRSIAVKVDRPDFTLNPTSCEVKSLTAEAIAVTGNVANLQNRFQVGGCTNLGFKPKLSLKLRGGTKRGDHPALTATLTYPKKGAYSNIAKARVALPHSEFLDTTHIKTICTRVQFAASQCPKGAIYGKARAITPLLDKPLEGPVYLRSSSNPLPDLVADLNGQIHVVLAGKVDSVNGGTRNTFQAVPDAPVSKFTLSLPAGKKGLLQNSTDICRGTHKATADFTAHNGKTIRLKPELVAKCPKGRKGEKRQKQQKPPSHRRP